MERMTKVDENIQTAQNLLSGIVERCYELEEENKTLKDNVEFLHSCLDDRDKSIAIMEEENKELKEWAEENSYLRAKLRKIEGELEITKKERDEYKERRERSFSV